VETYEAVRYCAVELHTGKIIQAAGVSAGNGSVIDWRSVKSGETLQTDCDVFDTARLFVALVGPEVAMRGEGVPEIAAWMRDQNGRRRRSFDAQGMHVTVESIDHDDELQVWFTHELAKAAADI
jgi:hypothetical protein